MEDQLPPLTPGEIRVLLTERNWRRFFLWKTPCLIPKSTELSQLSLPLWLEFCAAVGPPSEKIFNLSSTQYRRGVFLCAALTILLLDKDSLLYLFVLVPGLLFVLFDLVLGPCHNMRMIRQIQQAVERLEPKVEEQGFTVRFRTFGYLPIIRFYHKGTASPDIGMGSVAGGPLPVNDKISAVPGEVMVKLRQIHYRPVCCIARNSGSHMDHYLDPKPAGLRSVSDHTWNDFVEAVRLPTRHLAAHIEEMYVGFFVIGCFGCFLGVSLVLNKADHLSVWAFLAWIMVVILLLIFSLSGYSRSNLKTLGKNMDGA